MKFNEIINEDRQRTDEVIFLPVVYAASLGYTAYEIYNNYNAFESGKITAKELAARVGGDVALALAGGGLLAGFKMAVKGVKLAKGTKNLNKTKKEVNDATKELNDLKNKKIEPNAKSVDKLKNKSAINDAQKKLDNLNLKQSNLGQKIGQQKRILGKTRDFYKGSAVGALVPDSFDPLRDPTYKALGGKSDEQPDSGTDKDGEDSKGSKDSKGYDRYISSLKKGMSAADKAKYGNTDIKYDRNKSPETKAVFDKYSALGAKGLDYNKDNKIVKPDVKKVKTDVKKVKSNKDIKYDRNADVTQGSTISQKPVVKFNPVNQKPITNPNPTTVKDKDTGGIINKNIDKDFIEKNMPGKTLNKKGVIVKKEDVVEDFVSEENKTTKYQFLNNELAEAKYMRTDRDTIGRSSDNIAQGFFEHLLVLQQMRFENPTWAQKYAKDTMRYMSFNNVRTGATDLHNLASIVNNPAKYASKIGNSSATINELGFKRYLRNIINGKYVPGQDRAFFLATQKSLGIKNSLLKQARRVMSDYGVTNKNERASVSTRLTNSFRQDSRYRSDVFKPYASTIKKNKVMPPEKKGMGIAAKTAIGMVGGAVAGYKLGQWASS